ncbi:GH25 family lysozyme, partial [Arthrobacter sp. 2YAF22_2]|uniref:GH25 family lysozyme n=1 Tax=Arthrobacter sp. 2YAF22_2 TaxID=3233029 RepID=UPI003F8DE7C4
AMASATAGGGAEMGQGLAIATTNGKTLTTQSTWAPTFGVLGMDVSEHQPGVNWQQQRILGARFAYIKATEGNYYANPIFGAQYAGARDAGLIRGAYHYANPAASSGADQARIFVASGGGWSADGYTMPPVLDFEGNPYAGKTINGFYQGNSCYDMSPGALAAWARDFSNTMQALTGRLPVIYTGNYWWNDCVGNPLGFGDNPLWLASYPSSASNDAGPIPASWPTYSIWQYADSGQFAGDQNVWNGSTADLTAFANAGIPPTALNAIAATASATAALGSKTSEITCGLRDGGCYQLFQNGAVIWSSNTGAQPSLYGPVRDAWSRTGFESGALGYPTSALICGIRDNGCYQAYQRGEILYSTASGAQPSTPGAIRTVYRQAGAENSALAYPTSPELCGIRNGGCYQTFQHGEILWSPATGAQLSEEGPIRTAYRQAGAENSTLGYPTSGKLCGLKDGGCYQGFETGAIILSPATGAQISPNGPIRDAWAKSGFESGPLGYPTGSVTCGLRDGGCYQLYQNGAIIWSPASGAQLSLYGNFRTAWASSGYENGPLGYPTSSVICGLRDAGCYQAYQKGEILWAAATGAQVSSPGGIRALYRASGAENGTLAYPTGPETCGLVNGGCYQNFQGGAIIWSPAIGAQLSPNGPIRTAWAANRYETGTLAYPTSPVTCGLTNGGCYQNYQGGAIIWSPTTGAQLSPNGPIRTLWATNGYETGRLGYPTGPQTCTPAADNCTQTYQNGKITWTPTRGAYLN